MRLDTKALTKKMEKSYYFQRSKNEHKKRKAGLALQEANEILPSKRNIRDKRKLTDTSC